MGSKWEVECELLLQLLLGVPCMGAATLLLNSQLALLLCIAITQRLCPLLVGASN